MRKFFKVINSMEEYFNDKIFKGNGRIVNFSPFFDLAKKTRFFNKSDFLIKHFHANF
jgi:hypothetical protein